VLNTIKPKPTIVPLEGHIGLTVYFLQFFLFTFTGQKFFLSEIFPGEIFLASVILYVIYREIFQRGKTFDL
jgi:hypothetical protein